MCRLQNSCGGLNLHDGWRGNGETQTVLGLKPNFALLFGELLKLPPMPSGKVNKHRKASRLLKRIFSVYKSGGSHLVRKTIELGDKLG